MPKKSDLMLQEVARRAIGLGSLLGEARVNFINYDGPTSDGLKSTIDFFQMEVIKESRRLSAQYGHKAGDVFYDTAWAISSIMVAQNKKVWSER